MNELNFFVFIAFSVGSGTQRSKTQGGTRCDKEPLRMWGEEECRDSSEHESELMLCWMSMGSNLVSAKEY